jgi:GT2 family glycosyltransferase
LAVCLRLVDALAPRVLASWSPRPMSLRPARPGISILIPERGTPARLAACLESVEKASASITEPVTVVVVVNGSDPRDYRQLVARHPGVQWHFEPRPLGFVGAIARGLPLLAHDWVYLLNSDMTLEPDTLTSASALRDARTFAIASQIFFADPARRREETGWTDYRVDRRVTQHFDRTPEGEAVRGHLYAGGGASLFRTALLRRYSARTGSYAPFYFEDADWGVQAALDGYAVKFCPASRVRHAHRATIAQFYDAAEVARIVRRNQLLFEARHGFGGAARLLGGEPPRTRRELTSPATLVAILRQRWSTRRALSRGYSPELCCETFHLRPFCPERPTMLLVGRAGHAGASDLPIAVRTLAKDANVVVILTNEGEGAGRLPRGVEPATVVHVVGEHSSPAAKGAHGQRDADVRFRRLIDWCQRSYGTAAIRSSPCRRSI